MGNLGKVMYLTQAQYNTLQANGTLTVGGVTYTYSENDLYLVPSEDITVDTAVTQGSNNPVSSDAVYNAIQAVLASVLPSVTSADNGKVFTVVNGAWAAAELPTYQGGVS